MGFLKDVPIQRRITAVILLTALSTLLLVVAAFSVFEYRQFKQSLRRELSSAATIIGANSKAALEFDDRVAAATNLSVLREDRRVLAAILLDGTGETFALYHRDGPAGMALRAGDDERRVREDVVTVTHPIYHQGRRIGSIVIVATESELYRRLFEYATIAGLILLLSSALAYLLAVQLSGVISKPIRRLSIAAREISRSGDYSLRVTKESNDETGQLVDHFNEMLDEIARKNSALQESENQLRLITDSLPVLISYLDNEERYQFNNAEYERWFGLTPDQLRGMHVREVAGDALYSRIRNHIRRALRGEIVAYEERIASPNLGDRYVHVTMVPDRGSNGEVRGVFILSADISDRRAAEKEREQLLENERVARGEAERASRLKDEFLATLSHELRTPLSAIVGWSQLLQRPTRSPDDIEKGIAAIHRNARAQKQLIEDLLDLSRIISGKLRLKRAEVDVERAAADAVESVMLSANSKGIILTTEFEPNLPTVLGDASRIQQILWNLLTNAVKFTPSGGEVHLSIREEDGFVRVVVRDTGMGIEGRFLPHLFERFRQADASTTRQHGGLGIGLALVKQLVELHGGTVTAASEGEGRGATFIVQFPALSVPERRVERYGGASDTYVEDQLDLTGVHALVVDDEADARELVKRVLEHHQAQVHVAGSASEGFELLKQLRPDVVVSDIGMSRHDGYELMRWIRALRPEQGGKTPSVALTAFARSEDRQRALMSGYQAHLAKPVEPVELVTVVASLVGRLGG